MKKNIIITVVLALVLGLIAWRLASNKKVINTRSRSTDTAAIAIPIRTDSVRSQGVDMSIVKTGTITPFKESKVFATGSATITQLNVELGSHVVRGQVLAVLDNRTNALELQRAQAAAAKAKSDLETYRELLEGKATTAQKVKDLEQSYNDALNQVSQLQKRTGDAYIKAPITGEVTAKNVEAGVFASPGTEIASIVDITRARVQVYLSEQEVYQVKKGQTVKITADVFPDQSLQGVVSFISPQADAAHNYLVEVTVNNTGATALKSGTFITADFVSTSRVEALVLPSSAIMGSGQDASVYLVKDNRVVLKKITTGRALAGAMEVTEGIQAGDVVVTSGQINLKDGSLIRVSK